MLRFLAVDLWPRLRALARLRRRRAFVAVPLLGRDAARQLPLRRGDILVTKFDERSVSQGVVSPQAIVEFIRRNVRVYSAANLHAKVFVFGRTAIVGSSNISTLSERQLIEAGCETTHPPVVAACRSFVEELADRRVGLAYARSLIKLYRPAHIPFDRERQRRPITARDRLLQPPDLTAIRLQITDFDALDRDAARVAQRSATKRRRDVNAFKLDEFSWPGTLPSYLARYSRVLMCVSSGRTCTIFPPGRILEIHP